MVGEVKKEDCKRVGRGRRKGEKGGRGEVTQSSTLRGARQAGGSVSVTGIFQRIN